MARQNKSVAQEERDEKPQEAQTQIEPRERNSQAQNGHAKLGQNGSAQMAAGAGRPSLKRRDTDSEMARTQQSLLRMRQAMDEVDRMGALFGMPSLRRMGVPALFDLAPRSLGEMQQEQQAAWSPQVELFEREGQLVVRADLPGLKKDDVHIEVEDNVLSLRGERRSEHEERQQGFYRSERSYGSFQRSFRLPEGIRPDQVKANFENGVLEITLPTPQPPQPKSHRVEIS